MESFKAALLVLGLALAARLTPTARGDCELPDSSQCIEDMTVVCRNSLRAADYICYHNVYVRKIHLRLDPDSPYEYEEPGTLENSQRIFSINASGNTLDSIPAVVFTWKGLIKATFSHNRIGSLNFENYYNFENFKYLDLSFNSIDRVYLRSDDRQLDVYSTLKYLNLQHNLINFIPEEMFIKFKIIEILILSHNHIQIIDSSTFYGLEKIMYMDLSHNNIRSLNMALVKCRTLKKLILDNNELSELNNYDFRSLNNLEILTLKNNNISVLPPSLFSSLENLEELYLNNNHLIGFPKASKIDSARKLNVLDMSNNFISFIEPGLFANNSQITALNLGDNKLEGNLQRGQFSGLSQIKHLNFSFHKLSSVEDLAFSGMYSLATLDISNNNLSFVAAKAFDGLNNLIKLDLSQNSLREINFNLKNIVSLSWLSLRNNKLSELPHQFVAQLVTLRYLDISSNSITHINSHYFTSMINLQQLNVENNPISGSIEKYAFADLVSVPQLDLSHSNLTGISNDSFNRMNSLEFLNVSCSSLSGIEYEAFRETKILRVIDLSHNRLSQFFVNTSNLLHLEELNIAYNNIAQITPLTFDKLNNLKLLNLAHNNLSNINDASFGTLLSLTFLDISFNTQVRVDLSILRNAQNLTNLSLAKINSVYGFSNISGNSLKILSLTSLKITNLKSLEFQRLASLERLNLDKNEICSIDKNSFSNMSYLQVLDLHSNIITDIIPGSFKNMEALMRLDLSYNLINSLSYGLLLGLQNLETLNLSYNKIVELDVYSLSNSPSLSKLIIDGNMINDINLQELLTSRISTISLGHNPLKCKTLMKYKMAVTNQKSERSAKITALTLDNHHENVDGITCVSGKYNSTGKSEDSSVNNFVNGNITNNLLEDIKTILIRNELPINQNKDSNFEKTLIHNITNITHNLEKIVNMMQKESDLQVEIFTKIIKENQNINKYLDRNGFSISSSTNEQNSHAHKEQNLTTFCEKLKSEKEITKPVNFISVFILVDLCVIVFILLGIFLAMYKSSKNRMRTIAEGLEFDSI